MRTYTLILRDSEGDRVVELKGAVLLEEFIEWREMHRIFEYDDGDTKVSIEVVQDKHGRWFENGDPFVEVEIQEVRE